MFLQKDGTWGKLRYKITNSNLFSFVIRKKDGYLHIRRHTASNTKY